MFEIRRPQAFPGPPGLEIVISAIVLPPRVRILRVDRLRQTLFNGDGRLRSIPRLGIDRKRPSPLKRVCRSLSTLSILTRGGRTIALITISRPGGPGKAWGHRISNIGSCRASFNR